MMGREAEHGDVPFLLLAVLLAALVFVAAAQRGRPIAELLPDEWQCTASHVEQRAISTAQGPTMQTVQACDQWSRR